MKESDEITIIYNKEEGLSVSECYQDELYATAMLALGYAFSESDSEAIKKIESRLYKDFLGAVHHFMLNKESMNETIN